MSRYGLDIYGAAYYGPDGLISYAIDPFIARALVVGQLDLSWLTPTGTYDRLRLVRSRYGSPITPDDGTVLFDVPSSTPITSYSDTGLTQGAFYYYSMFVREPIGVAFKWHLVGQVSGLVITEYGYSDLLLDRLPTVFSTTPPSSASTPDADTLLARFLGIFGFQFNVARTTLESLRDNKNPDELAGQMLPLLAAELGQNDEPEIGRRQMRVLLRNSVYLFKKKGTTTGALAMASALTGWGATALPITNMVVNEDESSAELSVGSWTVISGPGTLTRRASDALVNPAVIPPGAIVGYRNPTNGNTSNGMFQLTGTGVGAVVLRQGVAGSIPVTPAAGQITASVFLRDTGTHRTPQIAMRFYDHTQTLLTNPTETQSSGATASDWSLRQTVVATPPATACYMRLELTYPAIINSEIQYFDGFQVEVGGVATTYRPARSLRVQLAPNRTNLVTNPSFEVDTAGWTVTGNVTPTRSATQHRTTGSYSGKMVVTLSASPTTITTSMTLVGGTPYMVQVPLFLESASTATTLYADVTGPSSFDSANTLFDLTQVGVWQVATFTITPTATGVHTLRVVAPANAFAGTFYLDEVLLEAGNAVLPYFDGGITGTLDYGWMGTANASSSVQYTQRAVRDYRLKANLPRYLPAGSSFSLEYADPYSAPIAFAPITDNFNRVNGALGYTVTGQPWVVTGNAAVVSNQAKSTSGLATAVVDALFADCTISLDVAAVSNGESGIIFRYLDASNYLRWVYEDSGGTHYLKKKVAGVDTMLAGFAGSQAQQLKVVLSANTIKVYAQDGTAGGAYILAGTVTETFNQTVTKHGMLFSTSATAIFDNFSITT